MISRIFRLVKTFFLYSLDEIEYYYGYKGGEKIKKLRKEAGMTQAELTSKLGLKDSRTRKFIMGHSQGNITDDVYTDISKLIPKMVKEIGKFNPMKDIKKNEKDAK